jgi:hypothetical protein
MSATNSTVGIKADVKRVGNKVAYSHLVEAFVRLGYGVRGLIYITMGILAANVVLGKGGAPASQQGAIAAIGKQPAGMFLLWMVLIGLISYSLWGIIRAIFDPLHKGTDTKGLIDRGGFLFSAASYGLLIPTTYGYISGAGSAAGSSSQTQTTMASIMATPWGPWAIGLIGLAVIGGGLQQIFEGFNATFDKQFQTYAMNAQEVKVATQLGRLGTVTRGFIFALVGGLLCMAAYQSNSSQGIGLDSALKFLMRQPYGTFLLGFVALGLMAFGIYSMLSAVWFRLKR